MRVGLVGTGYAAKLRAETLGADSRSRLVAVAGHTPEKIREFSQTYQAEAMNSWVELVERSDLNLVIVATVNRDHGAIVRAALAAGKHVVVEYPLSVDVAEAAELITLAQTQRKLLHVEHIELLSGIHQALIDSLPAIGTPFYVRYATLNPQNPAPRRWTYQPELFGFPLIGAISRLHRLINLFGSVTSVHCQTRYCSQEGIHLSQWTESNGYYKSCVCTAQLGFSSGLIAEVVYGKGESFWQPVRSLEIQGNRGALVFDGDQGVLIQGEEPQSIATGSRRGLFAKDTTMVLDHLLNHQPLYVTPEASLYSLRVADAARRSAENGQVIFEF